MIWRNPNRVSGEIFGGGNNGDDPSRPLIGKADAKIRGHIARVVDLTFPDASAAGYFATMMCFCPQEPACGIGEIGELAAYQANRTAA